MRWRRRHWFVRWLKRLCWWNRKSLIIKEEGVIMAKFVILDDGGAVSEDSYASIDDAVKAAKEKVTEDPDTAVEVAQVIKTVTSSLEVTVEDVK